MGYDRSFVMTAAERLVMPHNARLRTQDFRLLAEGGAFDNYARAELIDGEIFVVNAQFRRHATIRRKLTRQFEDVLGGRGDGLNVIDECNIEIGGKTMPQPDITLFSGAEDDGPIPLASVRLVIEIADNTASHDLGMKRDLYARNGIPEYWVIDVKGNKVVQFWSPCPEGYTNRRETVLGAAIAAITIDEVSVVPTGS